MSKKESPPAVRQQGRKRPRRKLPWMPLDVDGFGGQTDHLTAEETGAFIRLLLSMWRNGGSVPNDDKDFARVTRVAPRRWSRVKARLLPFLILTDDDRVTHQSIEHELARARNHRSDDQSGDQQCASDRGGASNETKGLDATDLHLHLQVTESYTSGEPAPSEGPTHLAERLFQLSTTLDHKPIGENRAHALLNMWRRDFPKKSIEMALDACAENCVGGVVGFIHEQLAHPPVKRKGAKAWL